MTLDRCLAEFDWAERSKLQGKLIDGRYHGIAIGCYLEGGGTGPRENARLVSKPTARYRSMSAHRRSVRASKRYFRRSPPMRSNCRWSASTTCFTARPIMSPKVLARSGRAPSSWGATPSSMPPIGLRALVREAAAQRLGCAANEISFDNAMVVGPDRAVLEFEEFAGFAADGSMPATSGLIRTARTPPMWRSIRGPARSH